MKKEALLLFAIFITVFFIYFGIGSQWTFKAPWDVDHFNSLAQSFLQGRLDIPEPADPYDLSFYKNRYYPYWGPIPAFLLIPAQLLLGRFVPTFYLNIFIGSLNVVLVFLLIKRLKKEFLPQMTSFGVFLSTLLFAFGTTHFYLSINGGVWHVAQIAAFLPTTLGIYLIFKKRRKPLEYFISSFLISSAFLIRISLIFLIAIPFLLGLADKKVRSKTFLLVGSPFLFFLTLFCLYNWARFGHPLETGYSFVIYHPHFAPAIEKYGVYSPLHAFKNIRFLAFHLPKINIKNGLDFQFDLQGNSIFFLCPPLLAVFLSKPLKKKKNKLSLEPYQASLWLGLLLVLVPILSIYTTGWIQFGYRFSLDFMIPLLLLSLFGVKGRLSTLFVLGISFSIWMQYLGITALQ